MTDTFTIWGPATGSSLMTIGRTEHGRIKITGQTDFGETHCHFTDDQARKIRDALNKVLGDE